MNLLDTLKQAREALLTWELMHPNTTACALRTPAIRDIRTAIAELEKVEPVAWMWKSPINGNLVLDSRKPNDTVVGVPLYTHPAPAVPEEQWITELRYELMKSKMTHNFTFSRNEVIALLNAAPKGTP